MKCVMIFLVLTLVVLMAEPGECFFGRLKAAFKAFMGHKRNRGIPADSSDGATGQQGGNGSPQSEENNQVRARSKR